MRPGPGRFTQIIGTQATRPDLMKAAISMWFITSRNWRNKKKFIITIYNKQADLEARIGRRQECCDRLWGNKNESERARESLGEMVPSQRCAIVDFITLQYKKIFYYSTRIVSSFFLFLLLARFSLGGQNLCTKAKLVPFFERSSWLLFSVNRNPSRENKNVIKMLKRSAKKSHEAGKELIEPEAWESTSSKTVCCATTVNVMNKLSRRSWASR